MPTSPETEKLLLVSPPLVALIATWNYSYSPRAARIRTLVLSPGASAGPTRCNELGTTHTMGVAPNALQQTTTIQAIVKKAAFFIAFDRHGHYLPERSGQNP